MRTMAAAVAAALGLLTAGCAANIDRTPLARTTTAAASGSPAAPLSVTVTGLPSGFANTTMLVPGAEPREFAVQVRNPDTADGPARFLVGLSMSPYDTDPWVNPDLLLERLSAGQWVEEDIPVGTGVEPVSTNHSELVVDPGSEISVTYRISAPADAPAGGPATLVVSADPPPYGDDRMIDVSLRVGTSAG